MKTNQKINEIKKDKLDQLNEDVINDFDLDKLFHSAILEAFIAGRKSILADFDGSKNITDQFTASDMIVAGWEIVDNIEDENRP